MLQRKLVKIKEESHFISKMYLYQILKLKFRIRARLHEELQPVLPMSHLHSQKPYEKHLRLHEKISAWAAEVNF